MWSVRVVLFNRFSQLIPHGSDAVCQEVSSVIEFFFEGSVSALDTAVICWPAWRQDNEGYVHICTSLLEFGHEFRAAVDLYGFDFEWCFVDKLAQEPLGTPRVLPRFAQGAEEALACE